MNKFIYLVLLFSSLYLFSQEKTINVEYSLTFQSEKDLFKDDAIMLQFYNNAISNAKNETFTLLINQSNSKFYHNETLSADGISRTPLFANYDGKTYVIENVLFVQSMLLGSNVFVKKSITKDWTITTETKMIDSYKCFKATNTYQVISPNKVFNHPVIAWFCPDLPYNHGPNGYGNLPGLILDLQIRNVVYGVKKIVFNSKEDFSLNELKNIKTLTQQEVDEILDKQMQERR